MIINSIIFRLGINRNWNSKFIYTKISDLDNYLNNIMEITSFINMFLINYNIFCFYLKINYNKYNLFLLILYSFKNFSFKKTIIFINLKNKLTVNFNISIIKNYFKFNYLNIISNFISTIAKFTYINIILNRVHIVYLIYLLRYKYFNFKQIFFFNFFINKFISIIKLFLNYKVSFIIIFKQLTKNTGLRSIFLINRQQLILNIIKLRKFDKFKFYNSLLNLMFSYIKLENNNISIILNILNSKLLNLKKVKFITVFLNYLIGLLTLYFLKLNLIIGFKIIIKGNLNKNKRATKLVKNIGSFINYSKINNNLISKKSICFTDKGTIGLKIFIKS